MPDSTPAGALFTDPRYIAALEDCGCVSPQLGWTPRHIQLEQGRALCYEKSHSWGEFVFDFELARAYRQYGLRYYPKLVCAVPFTPVPGPRLIAPQEDTRLQLAGALREQTRSLGCSSAHVLYLPETELQLLQEQGWLRRDQRRYLWQDRGYGSFEDFLAGLSSKPRKNIRRERRQVADFTIHWRHAGEIAPERWPQLYALYANTYELRGQAPYFNQACLQAWARAFPDEMRFCLAELDGELVAMAFFFADGDTLYGRHWGAAARFDLLHFELCYYQGIELCLREGLQHFDAGVQGGHKRLRGFDAALAHSAHWFEHEGFRAAIARAYAEESRLLASAEAETED